MCASARYKGRKGVTEPVADCAFGGRDFEPPKPCVSAFVDGKHDGGPPLVEDNPFRLGRACRVRHGTVSTISKYDFACRNICEDRFVAYSIGPKIGYGFRKA